MRAFEPVPDCESAVPHIKRHPCGGRGDIVLSLLFWGLANDVTSLRDAPILYPLFGLGNVWHSPGVEISFFLPGNLHHALNSYLPRSDAFCFGIGEGLAALGDCHFQRWP
jgi:TLC ATP/ADP transporter